MRAVYTSLILSVMICGLFAFGVNGLPVQKTDVKPNYNIIYTGPEKWTGNGMGARYTINGFPMDEQYIQYFTPPSLKMYKKMSLDIHEHLSGTPDLRGEGPEYKVFDLHTGDVKSVLLCGRITTHGRGDFVRVILLGRDEQGTVHIYPIIDSSLIYTPGFTLSGPNVYEFCGIGEETLSLPGRVTPEKLIVEGSNADVVLDSVYYLPYDESSGAGLRSSEYYLKGQNDVKIDMINKRNLRFEYKWVAGDTGISHYRFETKRRYLGTVSEKEDLVDPADKVDVTKWYEPLPNTYGIFYYKEGIFSVEPMAMMLDDSNKISFSWRNAHGQNWVTSVKHQGPYPTCYAFAATGSHELLINTYFAQHIDKDLSEQQVVSDDDGTGRCGDTSIFIDPGQVDESCFPYTGSSGTSCGSMCSDWDTRNWSITSGMSYHVRVDPKEVFNFLINDGNLDVVVLEWNHGVTGVGAEYYRNENVLVIEFKNSWGTTWGYSGFGKFYSTPNHLRLMAYQPPEYPPSGEPTDIMCYDNDGDGYCWWGTSDTKPSTCPASCAGNDVKDCDDSDPNKHGLINGWICADNSKHLTSCGVISSPGTYYVENDLSTSGDCITIDSDDVVLMCNQYSLTGSGSGSGIVVNSHDNVSVYGCVLTNFDTGISVTGPGSVLISDVNVSNSNTGISFTSVTGSIVKYVNIDNCDTGILLTSSDDNILYNNMLTNNNGGITLSDSSNNEIEANVIKNSAETGLSIDSGSTNNLARNLYSCGSGASDISDSGTGNRYKITACDSGDVSCDYTCSVGCLNLYWPDTYPENVSRIYKHGNHIIKIGNGFSMESYTLCPDGYYPLDYPSEQIVLGVMWTTVDFMNSTFVGRPLLLGDVSYTDYEFAFSGATERKIYPLIRDDVDGFVCTNVFKNLRIENVSIGAYHTRGVNTFDNVYMKNVDVGIYTFMPTVNNSVFENCDEACINTWDEAYETTTVENTVIMNSGGHYGIHITGSPSYTVVLKNNTICGSSDKDLYTTRTSGTIENNACDSSQPSGLCDATRTYYRDADGDGYGNDAITTTAACPPAGYTWRSGDCDDSNPNMHPGAEEVCDGLDNDCNGDIDDGLPTYTYYPDSDGDTFGDPASPYTTCYSTPPTGYVIDNTDCDDTNATVYPGASEVCDGVDQDCDSLFDEDFDSDGDGYTTCGYSVSDGSFVGVDCDDSNADINPGATEVCNEYDDNCDGNINEGFDSDGDTYTICGYSTLDGSFTGIDCDDTNADIHPGATEVCDGIDQDCDSLFDEDFDSDGDGYTTCGSSVSDGSFVGVDCDDTNGDVHPGAEEVCNGIDDNCNDEVDEGSNVFYQDADGDGYGDPTVSVSTVCSSPPEGYVNNDDDCLDDPSGDPPGCPTDPSGCDPGCPSDGTSACAICVNPGHTTECCDDSVDNNCDDLLDDEDPDCIPLGIDIMDMDGDGYNVYVDCDDLDPTVHPGAFDRANGRDDDCDGLVDEDVRSNHVKPWPPKVRITSIKPIFRVR